MFERYTERARRSIFFARYEASQFGESYISPEHLLLGILRDSHVVKEAIGGAKVADEIRIRVEKSKQIRERISTSVDIPLDFPSKRALAYAAEEADGLNQRAISEVHLVLGLLRADSFVAQLLKEYGVGAETLRELAFANREKRPDLLRLSPLNTMDDLAEQEALMLKQTLGPEHFLLAILRMPDSLAAKILNEHGITLETLREEIKKRGS